jgi:hypothetical protein
MLCKKLVYKSHVDGTNRTLLGILQKEDTYFFYFKTRTKNYRIAKASVLELCDTVKEFDGGRQ